MLTATDHPQQALSSPTDRDPWLTVSGCATRGHLCDASVRRAITKFFKDPDDPDGLRAVRIGQTYRVRCSWFDSWLERPTPPRIRSSDAAAAIQARNRHAATVRWEKYRARHAREAVR